jgi:UDP-glucose 4-epimerase
MKTLVTGGCGFIGSHLVEFLLSEGEQVIVLDNYCGTNLDILNKSRLAKNIEVVDGSILDKKIVIDLMSKVSKCFHLAASLGVERIVNNPLEALEVNLQGTENVLTQASRFGVKTLLASSSEIYGKNPVMPLTENSDRVLGSPEVSRWSYSEAKALDELYAYELGKHQSFQVTIARFFNTVGPRQNGAYGMVLPRFISAALKNKPLIVYGDGKQTRSFCSVTDTVLAMQHLINSDKSFGNAYNIGSPIEISITDLAKKVIILTNSTSDIIYKSFSEVYGSKFEEPRRRVPDISKITKTIGWEPKKNLDDVILEISKYLASL